MPSAELWSIVASIVSVVLGFLAIAMSVYFFVVGRKTEREVSNSLIKIETQADMLQKLSGRQMDRLTGYPLKAGHHMPQWFQAPKAPASSDGHSRRF